MNNKNVIIVAAVAVIVVSAGVGIYLLQSDEPVEERTYTNRLMIFGNANGDDYIDEHDVTTLESIIDYISNGGAWDREKNPFADANQDGKIDEGDVAFVKRMIKREKMDIYFLDIDNRAVKVEYPVKTVVAITVATFPALSSLGAEKMVKGRHNGNLDPIRHGYYFDLPIVKVASRGIDISAISNISQEIDGGLDAVVSRKTFVTPDNEVELNRLGITVIRLGFANLDTEQGSYLTLGYLMQKEKEAHDLVAFLGKVEKIVDDAVAAAKVRPKIIQAGGAGNAIICNEYDDCEWSRKAGVVNNISADVLGTNFGKYIQEGDVWQYGSEYDADYLVVMLRLNYDTPRETYVEKYKFLRPYFGQGGYYPEKVIILTTEMPSMIGSLYLAEKLYPDLIEAGTADGYLQTYITDFLKLEHKVSENTFCMTYEDVKDIL